jgi:hypothetical protein
MLVPNLRPKVVPHDGSRLLLGLIVRARGRLVARAPSPVPAQQARPPGPALTIEESVPGDSRPMVVTSWPPSLLTNTSKPRNRGLFVSSVVVTRYHSPLMLNTGDCLSPLPLVVFTTRAPGHSESGPGVFWSSRVESLVGALTGALVGALADVLAGSLTGALLGRLLATGDALASEVPCLGLPPSHCSTAIV